MKSTVSILKYRKDGLKMEIKVRVFLNNQQIEPSKLHEVYINNRSIDRIVNDIADHHTTKGSEDAHRKVS